MKSTNVSLTDFQDRVVERLTGAYAPSKSGVIRYIIQSYVLEHTEEIRLTLERFEAYKARRNQGMEP
jgi:hypothetical protein